MTDSATLVLAATALTTVATTTETMTSSSALDSMIVPTAAPVSLEPKKETKQKKRRREESDAKLESVTSLACEVKKNPRFEKGLFVYWSEFQEQGTPDPYLIPIDYFSILTLVYLMKKFTTDEDSLTTHYPNDDSESDSEEEEHCWLEKKLLELYELSHMSARSTELFYDKASTHQIQHWEKANVAAIEAKTKIKSKYERRRDMGDVLANLCWIRSQLDDNLRIYDLGQKGPIPPSWVSVVLFHQHRCR